MKVLCKRTYMERIKVVSEDKFRCRWGRDKYYDAYSPNEFESNVGIYYILESDVKSRTYPLKKIEFDKYFIDIDEIRNDRIEQILK